MTATCIVPNCGELPAPGIERCDSHERRRRYSRDWQRRKHAAAKAAREAGLVTCGYRMGRYVCGSRLRAEVVDRNTGRVAMICDTCRRRERGICQDCPRPVYGTVGRTLRCAEHAKNAQQRQARESEARNIEKRRVAAREYYQDDDERRERRNAYKRAWRKLNPDKVRAQKRRAALRQPKRVLQYHRKYRTKHREYVRLAARDYYYKTNPERPAPVCKGCGVAIPFEPPGRPMTRCDACVYPSERRRRETVRAARAAAVVEPAAKPVEVRAPKRPALRLEDGTRLCCVDGCETAVTGRTKKCERCKDRDRRWAAQALRQAVAA